MKTSIQLTIVGRLIGAVHAEFRNWNRENGKTYDGPTVVINHFALLLKK